MNETEGVRTRRDEREGKVNVKDVKAKIKANIFSTLCISTLKRVAGNSHLNTFSTCRTENFFAFNSLMDSPIFIRFCSCKEVGNLIFIKFTSIPSCCNLLKQPTTP